MAETQGEEVVVSFGGRLVVSSTPIAKSHLGLCVLQEPRETGQVRGSQCSRKEMPGAFSLSPGD